MSEINEQRWQEQVKLTQHWMEKAHDAEQRCRMLQDCLKEMMETTGRGVIRVEWRLTPDKEHIFVIASSAKSQLDHLASIVGSSYKAFHYAAENHANCQEQAQETKPTEGEVQSD